MKTKTSCNKVSFIVLLLLLLLGDISVVAVGQTNYYSSSDTRTVIPAAGASLLYIRMYGAGGSGGQMAGATYSPNPVSFGGGMLFIELLLYYYY